MFGIKGGAAAGVAKGDLGTENLAALEAGFINLVRHIENVHKFGVPTVVAINKFPTDTEAEIQLLKDRCAALGVEVVLADVFTKGGEGGIELAHKVVETCETKSANFLPLYDVEGTSEDKIITIAKGIYRAERVEFTPTARKQLLEIAALGLDKMLICVAKTPYSFSDNPNLLGAPDGFTLTVREVKISAGAGFIVALTGDIMTMPGLPKIPAANEMNITESGEISGLS